MVANYRSCFFSLNDHRFIIRSRFDPWSDKNTAMNVPSESVSFSTDQSMKCIGSELLQFFDPEEARGGLRVQFKVSGIAENRPSI
jgi:hypothetical protein